MQGRSDQQNTYLERFDPSRERERVIMVYEVAGTNETVRVLLCDCERGWTISQNLLFLFLSFCRREALIYVYLHFKNKLYNCHKWPILPDSVSAASAHLKSTVWDEIECLAYLPSNRILCVHSPSLVILISGDHGREKESERQRMIRTVLLLLIVVIGTQAQLLPPVRHDGFVYPPGRRFDPDTILIEAFFDPVCPDSRDSWPPLKQALQHYGSRVGLVLHLLPLPSVLYFSLCLQVLFSNISSEL